MFFCIWALVNYFRLSVGDGFGDEFFFFFFDKITIYHSWDTEVFLLPSICWSSVLAFCKQASKATKVAVDFGRRWRRKRLSVCNWDCLGAKAAQLGNEKPPGEADTRCEGTVAELDIPSRIGLGIQVSRTTCTSSCSSGMSPGWNLMILVGRVQAYLSSLIHKGCVLKS